MGMTLNLDVLNESSDQNSSSPSGLPAPPSAQKLQEQHAAQMRLNERKEKAKKKEEAKKKAEKDRLEKDSKEIDGELKQVQAMAMAINRTAAAAAAAGGGAGAGAGAGAGEGANEETMEKKMNKIKKRFEKKLQAARNEIDDLHEVTHLSHGPLSFSVRRCAQSAG
jgi:uncharacterized FlaG/YvyC family protein